MHMRDDICQSAKMLYVLSHQILLLPILRLISSDNKGMRMYAIIRIYTYFTCIYVALQLFCKFYQFYLYNLSLSC